VNRGINIRKIRPFIIPSPLWHDDRQSATMPRKKKPGISRPDLMLRPYPCMIEPAGFDEDNWTRI
jgi:hypothetical protein